MNILSRNKRTRAMRRIRGKFGKDCKHELTIFKSSRHIYVTVYDLITRKNLFSFSTLCFRGDDGAGMLRKDKVFKIGELCGKKCLANNIIPAVNRCEYRFHGHVETLINGFKTGYVE